MDLKEIDSSGMDWTGVAQDRDLWRALMDTVMNLGVPQNVRRFLRSCRSGSFLRRAQLLEVVNIRAAGYKERKLYTE
jgi:hypothetical protein